MLSQVKLEVSQKEKENAKKDKETKDLSSKLTQNEEKNMELQT